MAHIGLLGSIEAIADAKAELLRALPIDGFAILNADDDMVRRVSGRSTAPVIWYGYADDADVRIAGVESRGLQGSSFLLDCKGTTVRVSLSVPGRHVLADAAAAMALAQQLGLDLPAAAERLATFRPMKHRGEILQGVGGVTIYDDCYNSSPASLTAALEVLHSAGAVRKVAVVGDMLELGEAAAEAHREAGSLTARSADALIAVGEYASMVAEAATHEGMPREMVWTAADAEAAIPLVLPWCQSDVAMLVKGSRGVGLDKLVEAISGRHNG
jgi:UDP-N-acetylmuramoyl-tripeptide--D-alanyl-D-alanine ligase